MKTISDLLIQQFNKRYLIKSHIMAFTGFYLGVKSVDYFFYKEEPYQLLREKIEDEFWKKHGEPEEIEPYLVPSTQDPSTTRKSWIHIMFEKDLIVKKTENWFFL